MLNPIRNWLVSGRRDNTSSSSEDLVQSHLGVGRVSLHQTNSCEIRVSFLEFSLTDDELSALAEKVMGGFSGLFQYPVTVDVKEGVLRFSINLSDYKQPLLKSFSPRSIEEQLKDLSNQKGEYLFQDKDLLRDTLQRNDALASRAAELLPLRLAKSRLAPAIACSHVCVGRVIGQLLGRGIMITLDEDVKELINGAIDETICARTEILAELVEASASHDAGPNAEAAAATSSVDLAALITEASSDSGPSDDFALVRVVLEEVWDVLENNLVISSYYRETYANIVDATIEQLHSELSG